MRVPWTARRSNQSIHSKGDQSWVYFGSNDAKAETPVLWPLHAKSWLIGKDSDAGRDWGQEEKGMAEDEMAGWHHWLDGRESEWTLGVGDGQGGLVCCDSWGRRVGHDWVTELNWTEPISVCPRKFHRVTKSWTRLGHFHFQNCYVFLMEWLFIIMQHPHSVSGNFLCPKVYIFWYYYNLYCFLN